MTRTKHQLNRREEIAAELRRLRASSHPGEFFEEIERVYLARRRPAPPEGQHHRALPTEQKALELAAWKESGQGRETWAQANSGDDPDGRHAVALAKRLQRSEKLYASAEEFRGRVDFYRWALRLDNNP